MTTELTEIEARILGSLIEKSFLTPETYPLSFPALLNACNQKTSRDPVMTLEPDGLKRGLASLFEKGLAAERLGSRVPKYAHHAENLKAGETPELLGTLCLLLLRGPQTAAELRARSERLCQFPGNAEVEEALQKLASHPEGPFVSRLARGRWQHLFFGATPGVSVPLPPPTARAAEPSPLEKRLEELEARVAALEGKLNQGPSSS
ncbi:MAG TPA: DUF480 domain-containing protein [Elusimicrobia bacterium]|nr:DUF480 domain-containing protein [Elusimicrobiota bacterium]